MKKLVENIHGVHLMVDVEFTLCGTAFDAYGSEDDKSLELLETKSKIVTCERCTQIINTCRGVKVKERSL